MTLSIPVAKQGDKMFAIDPHDAQTPEPPFKRPFSPHICGATIGWVNDHGELAKKVFINGAPAARAFHDIGALIPHVPTCANLLAPLITALSSSKVLLNSGSVLVEGRPIAVHSLTLNCADPAPLPIGMLCTSTNVFAGVSMHDLLLSIGRMIGEITLACCLKWIVRGISSLIPDIKISFSFSQGQMNEMLGALTDRILAASDRVIGRLDATLALAISHEVWSEASERAGDFFTTKFVQTAIKQSQALALKQTLLASTQHSDVVVTQAVMAILTEASVEQTYTLAATEATKAILRSLGKKALKEALGPLPL